MGRLIDADAQIRMIDEEIRFLEETKAKTEKEYQGGFALRIAEANLIKQYVQNMPTAYDVEAVAEQMCLHSEVVTNDFAEEVDRIIKTRNAVEIVRNGGKE